MNQLTSYITLSSLLVTDAVIYNKNYTSDNLEKIRKSEIAILTVASSQYIVTLNTDNYRTQKWRYVDWIITTPLLLNTFYLLAKEGGYKESFGPVFIANMLMIFFGYLAEYPELTPGVDKWVWYVLSTLSLVFILYNVYKWDNFLKNRNYDTGNLAYFFYIGWTLYGINFLTPDEEIRQTSFNILDFFNKVVYSYEITRVINDFQ